MLNKLLRKDLHEETYQSKSKVDADENKIIKKKTGKKMLIYILLIVFSAVAGFSGMTLVATDNSGKKIQGPYRQFPGVKPHYQSPSRPAALQEQQVPVQNGEGKKQIAERTAHNAEDATQKVEDL